MAVLALQLRQCAQLLLMSAAADAEPLQRYRRAQGYHAVHVDTDDAERRDGAPVRYLGEARSRSSGAPGSIVDAYLAAGRAALAERFAQQPEQAAGASNTLEQRAEVGARRALDPWSASGPRGRAAQCAAPTSRTRRRWSAGYWGLSPDTFAEEVFGAVVLRVGALPSGKKYTVLVALARMGELTAAANCSKRAQPEAMGRTACSALLAAARDFSARNGAGGRVAAVCPVGRAPAWAPAFALRNEALPADLAPRGNEFPGRGAVLEHHLWQQPRAAEA
eukprot:TRINITY_DN7159_c0_g1_i12.p3 TRINITY_DN7159_c0_g1~~TRINITY_DN7159_c0_g1_i12.p3  ORF type:complete len:278 (+),score=70.69 TRINITY_DN7159_c0_g1_i12:276-1109(+)